MNKTETAKLLTLLQSEYPLSFAKLDEDGMKMKRELWASEFKDDSFNAVYTAVRMCMETGSDFAPNIGQVRAKMRKQNPDNESEMTASEAWALVSKACRNGSYGYMKEFAKLPPVVQRAVGRPEQLKEWAAMDEETVQSVIASNFMKSFRLAQAQEEERKSYPPALMEMITKLQIGGNIIKELEDGGD